MSKQFVFNYEQTEKILARRILIDREFEEMKARGIADTMENLRSAVNKRLYEWAEQNKMSLYDVCFNNLPDYTLVTKENEAGKYEITTLVTFLPAQLTFEPEERWIKVSDRLPENDATSVLRCDHPTIEGGCELYLGYFDGESFYTEDGELVHPTHYMPISLPTDEN